MALLLIFLLLIITMLRLKLNKKIAVSGGTKAVEIMVLLKYLSNFWRTLEMTLINCEINLTLTWFDRCVLSNDVKQQHSQ